MVISSLLLMKKALYAVPVSAPGMVAATGKAMNGLLNEPVLLEFRQERFVVDLEGFRGLSFVSTAVVHYALNVHAFDVV